MKCRSRKINRFIFPAESFFTGISVYMTVSWTETACRHDFFSFTHKIPSVCHDLKPVLLLKLHHCTVVCTSASRQNDHGVEYFIVCRQRA